ncbi:hypothetical protein K8I28_17130 [bacterium]|nr:hypothetical protein [bacterium]
MKQRIFHVSPIIYLLVPFMVLLVIGCTDGDDPVSAEAGPIELTSDGWKAFEDTDFESALDYFNSAIKKGYDSADPYSGAGWTIFLGSSEIDAALTRWNTGLEKPGGKYDIQAGLGFAHLARNDYTAAISAHELVLGENANYIFKHRTDIDYRDLRWTIAQCFYMETEFDSSFSWVQTLNSNFTVDDVNTAEGKRLLAIEIERLGQQIR